MLSQDASRPDRTTTQDGIDVVALKSLPRGCNAIVVTPTLNPVHHYRSKIIALVMTES